MQRLDIVVRNLQEFHQMLQWQTTRARDSCVDQPPRRVLIATWFSDPITLPRCDHSREVILSTQPVQWPTDILQRWADFLQPNQPVEMHVAVPDPPGGSPEIIAHVIVVQNPTHDQVAVSRSLWKTPGTHQGFARCYLLRSHAMSCLPRQALVKIKR